MFSTIFINLILLTNMLILNVILGIIVKKVTTLYLTHILYLIECTCSGYQLNR